MFRNNFKTAWRNLFKNKFHTGINIAGLVVGFTIGIAILLVVYSQLSFDKFHAGNKKLFQAYMVSNKPSGEEINSGFGFPAAPVFKAEASAIEKSTGILYGGSNAWYKEREVDVPVMLVDEDFLSMFT